MIARLEPDAVYMGNLDRGADLLESLTRLCADRGVSLGRITGIGAVQKAAIGYFDQASKEYQTISLDRRLEITSLLGNVSLKEGNPMVHAHITLADEEGRCYGGHLAPGTVVFVFEYQIEVFTGDRIERVLDPDSGLFLWK